MPQLDPRLEARAREIISGGAVSLNEALDIDRQLSAKCQFGLARKVLAEVRPEGLSTSPGRLKLAQRRCLSTYKDPDLPADWRLAEALRILGEADDLATTRDQESLGLAGSIFKGKWKLTSSTAHLETALSYYYRGYRCGIASDTGYTAVNTAFVLDVLCSLGERSSQPAELHASTHQSQLEMAQRIRGEVVAALEASDASAAPTWWWLATIGEAYFGLEQFAKAAEWLGRAAAMRDQVEPWQVEATARQLAELLTLIEGRHAGESGAARRVLLDFLQNDEAALESTVRGKTGLALSGGGFRASLYHIGVLARLAELDQLRHVEFLSCVSGGSIIGAHYYLEVRKLLTRKADQDITRDDYIEIVDRIAREFTAGVQRNVRVRIASELTTNLKLIFVPGYSRTRRAGELYESELFSRVDDGEQHGERWLDALQIHPAGEPDGFAPKSDNWRRRNKVPILVLNATCLNSGHNWQFTSTWMGEPPAGIVSEVDANYRLRRMYYPDAPEPNRHVRLGDAVAASACVPGIFEPLTLSGLYEYLPPGASKKVRPVVRLVDGGVFDNQGTSSLLEQDCAVILVSDASGQMGNVDFPGNGLVSVPLRANSILQARVRTSEYQQLAARKASGMLRGLMFVHLKKCLDSPTVDWRNSQDPSPASTVKPLLPYGIQRETQRLLAALRTDLDSFSDVEACALMCSGYLATSHELETHPLAAEPAVPPRRQAWPFLRMVRPLQDPAPDSPLVRQLRIGGQLFGKVWRLVRILQVAAGVVIVFLAGGAVYAIFANRALPMTFTVGQLAWAALTGILGLMGAGVLSRVLNYRKTVSDMFIGVGMAVVGWWLARLHLHVFDRIFLWQGRVERLAPTAPPASSATPPDGSTVRPA